MRGLGVRCVRREAGKRKKEPGYPHPHPNPTTQPTPPPTHQDFLKKNNGLIQKIEALQKEATEGQGEQGGGGGGNTNEGQKKVLQQCAEMIKELNDNLTQVGGCVGVGGVLGWGVCMDGLVRY